MAPTGKKAPEQQESLIVGMDESEFQAGGLATDFDGEVVEARTVIWNYDNGNGPRTTQVHDDEGNVIGEEPLVTLAVRITIKRDDDEPDVVNYWSAGDVNNFQPSMDGKTPAPLDEAGCSEGIYFIKVGSKAQLNNNTNYAQALQALADAESQAPALKRQRTPSVQFLEGLYGHWERIPQRKRSGIVKPENEAKKKFPDEVLVCTVVKAKPAGSKVAGKIAPKAAPAAPKAAPAKPTPTTSSASTSANTGSESLDEKLIGIVMQAALDAGDDGIAKGKLSKFVLADATLTQPEKAKGVPRVANTAFLEAGMEAEKWLFDAETGLVNSWPQEEAE